MRGHVQLVFTCLFQQFNFVAVNHERSALVLSLYHLYDFSSHLIGTLLLGCYRLAVFLKHVILAITDSEHDDIF